jgi:hypothetical protein
MKAKTVLDHLSFLLSGIYIAAESWTTLRSEEAIPNRFWIVLYSRICSSKDFTRKTVKFPKHCLSTGAGRTKRRVTKEIND